MDGANAVPSRFTASPGRWVLYSAPSCPALYRSLQNQAAQTGAGSGGFLQPTCPAAGC